MTCIATAVEKAKDLLRDRPRFPWKTAAWLSRELRRHGVGVSSDALETALLGEAELDGRQVRYSIYPGRRTLDLIWGHVDHVGDRGSLPPPMLEPDPALAEELGEVTPCIVPEGAPWCFLSHNFHDVRTALAIREELIGRGYGVWLAETEILQGEMITASVQQGLQRADVFVVLMSGNALASRWVLKESGVAIRQLAHPPVVVVDAAEPAVAALFADWVRGTWSADRAARIDEIAVHKGHEPSATLLHELLAAFDDVAMDKRIVVLHPPPRHVASAPLATWDAVFPRQGEGREQG
jgi:hypothetical protein